MPTGKAARIAADLRAEITAGRLEPGAKVPSETDLMARYEVSRTTVRNAVATLVNEGLAVSRHGSGTYVASRVALTYHATTAERGAGRGETDAYVGEVTAAGRRPTQTFTMRIEPASADVAARLGVDTDDLVVVRRCFRFVDGQPWSDQHSYYPMDVSEKAGLAVARDLPEGTIRAMARAGHTEVGYVDEVTTRMPTPDEAHGLDLGPGVPVLVYVRTAYTDARPVRLTKTVFAGDRNRLVYELGDLRALGAEPA